MRVIAILLAILGLLGSRAHAAEETGCEDPRSRQFDFWIGDWEVRNSDGSVAGRNTVEPLLDDCVLQERWLGISGSAGTSLNFFDPSRGRWRQLWVWREGTTLELEGGLVGDRMVLEGDSTDEGKTVRNRISWIPRGADGLRQLWELSRDGGRTWEVVFDGQYRPADSR
jgi:hypothetical protein